MQLNANSHETRSHNKFFQWRPMHEYAKNGYKQLLSFIPLIHKLSVIIMGFFKTIKKKKKLKRCQKSVYDIMFQTL